MPLKDKDEYNKYMNEYMKEKYRARRNIAYNMLGNKCARCESTENLELDHIDPKTKTFKFNKLWSCKISTFYKELTKIQLLCNSCHIEKSKIDNSKGH